MKYDVFISYSHVDIPIADQVCAALARHGFSYFIDRERIPGGNGIADRIAEAIVASKVFLFLGSEASYKSTYTTDEISFAKNKLGTSRILPYLIDDSPMPGGIELLLSNTMYRSSSKHSFEPVVIEDIKLIIASLPNDNDDISDSSSIVRKERDKQPATKPHRVSPLKWGLSILSFLLIACLLLVYGKDYLTKSKGSSESDFLFFSLDNHTDLCMVRIDGPESTYYIGQTTITYQQWYAVMQDSLPTDAKADLPKTWVYWDDCLRFAANLTEKTKKCFSLPTIDEWSFAAEADYETPLCGSDNLNDVAWYSANSKSQTHPVRQKRPNAWGLYDMLGNVWEFCSNPVIDSRGEIIGHRVCGGSFDTSAKYCLPNGVGLNNYNDYGKNNLPNKSKYHGFRLKMDPSRTDYQAFADSLRGIVRDRMKL